MNKQNDGIEIKNERTNVFDLVQQSTFIIKPGRAMRQGEITVSMYELDLKNLGFFDSNSAKPDFEIILQKNVDTVLTWKLKLLNCLKLDERLLDKLNIRQKGGSKKVYHDELEIKEINNINYFKDFLFDICDDENVPPAAKRMKNQRSIFFQRWFPSDLKFDDKLIPVTLEDDNEEVQVEHNQLNKVDLNQADVETEVAIRNDRCHSPGDSVGIKSF